MEEGLWLKLKNTIIRMKDLSHLGIANIIGKIIAAVFWFFLAALLGAEAYGEVSYLIATATIVAGLSLLGGTETITVYSAKKIPIQPPIFLITAIIGAIGSLVIYFILDNIVISFFNTLFALIVIFLIIRYQLILTSTSVKSALPGFRCHDLQSPV